MRVKNGKKRTRSIRYLLYADPGFQRISLRKIKPPRSVRSKESVRAKKSTRVPSGIHATAMVLVVIGAVAAATLIAAHQPRHRGDVATVAASSELNAAPKRAIPAAQPETKKNVGTNVPAAPHATFTVAARTARASTASLELVKNMAVERPADSFVTASAVKAEVQEPAAVIITGCLEFDGDTFLLHDTSGVDAPKSRSWKSGFLKKRSTPITISDAANTLTLSNYVGQRVAATGMLISREMQVRSLQRVAAGCG